MDSSAYRSIIGELKIELYRKSYGSKRKSIESKFRYQFSDSLFRSRDVLHVRIPVTGAYSNDAYPEIVEADVSLHILLDILTQLSGHLDFDENKISSKHDGWTLHLTKLLFIYISVARHQCLYRYRAEKMYHYFHHPSTEKLSAVTKRACHENYSLSLDRSRLQKTLRCLRLLSKRVRWSPSISCISHMKTVCKATYFQWTSWSLTVKFFCTLLI